MSPIVDLQIACELAVPELSELEEWVKITLAGFNLTNSEVTIRFVEREESRNLNHQYRGKNKATNVLSFPFDCPPDIRLNFIGDLVICPAVMLEEAQQQQKLPNDHYAHLVIHGILHLSGYDHIEMSQAEEMESLEIRLLAKLGIDDPYQDH